MGSLPGVHRNTTCPKGEPETRFGERVGVPRRARFGTAGRRRPTGDDAAERGLGTPSTTFTMIHPPFGDSFNLLIITLNSLMEWLLIPAALFLNWHIPKRRTLIVIAAVVFYAMRIW